MPSDISFRKMHGAGNDFIMIEDRAGTFAPGSELIAFLCERHRGIGADGMILLRSSTTADFRMLYFNSDGGEARMCGNGARCAARFALDIGVAGPRMTFETAAGRVHARVERDVVSVAVGPVTGLRLAIAIPGVEGEVGFADSGVPHAALFVDDARAPSRDSFLRTARMIRSFDGFGPEGANANLVTVTGERSLVYRTYERGVEDETLACGTGAIAASVIAASLGLVEPPVACETSGGDLLTVSFEPVEGGASSVILAGPAATSFKGTFDPGVFGPGCSS
ncbi:MAG: diaminopimelate epimerase [Candidatus Krumholzibacteria bacterium]|nr:diaminopimelate epimerase [Candidatus Krumholzibacteria bacterium]